MPRVAVPGGAGVGLGKGEGLATSDGEGDGDGDGEGDGDGDGLGDGDCDGDGDGVGDGAGAPVSSGRMSPTFESPECCSKPTPYASSNPRRVPYSLPPLACVPCAEPTTTVSTCSDCVPSSQVRMMRAPGVHHDDPIT